jgi:hypothetical protein
MSYRGELLPEQEKKIWKTEHHNLPKKKKSQTGALRGFQMLYDY